jgi:hypothetical protein
MAQQTHAKLFQKQGHFAMDQLFFSVAYASLAGIAVLQLLGMLWAIHETGQMPALQRSWTRVFLVVCWPVCFFLVFVIKRL